MANPLNRVRRLLAANGPRGALDLAAAAALRRLLWPLPRLRRARAEARARDREFDRVWGVETSGDLLPRESEVIGPHWIHGIKYQACDAAELERLLHELPVEHERFTFVDYGAGKGRALLTAARFPFRRVVGVEYAPRLACLAACNAARFPAREWRCGEIAVVCADAADFEVPEGPLVAFLFNPFGRRVMERVVARLAEAYRREPRRMVAIYINPRFGDLWRRSGFLREVRTWRRGAVFDSEGGA